MTPEEKEMMDEIAKNVDPETHNYFREQQLEKRKQFFQKVHAAFVLETSVNVWGKIKQRDLTWLLCAYPNSKIETGNDQGATYNTITPKF